VLVPTAARADSSNPLAPVTDPLQQAVGTLTGQSGALGGTSGSPASGGSGTPTGSLPQLPAGSLPSGGLPTGSLPQLPGGSPTSPTSPTSSGGSAGGATSGTSPVPGLPPLDLSQLNGLLTQLGISTQCSTAVEKDLTQTVTDIPATAQQLATQVVGQLEKGGAGLQSVLQDPQSGQQVLMTLIQQGHAVVPQLTSTNPTELPLAQDLQQLFTDLLTRCGPQGSGSTPSPSSPSSPSAGAHPAAGSTPAAAKPVSYPGYAPTSGDGPADGGSTPRRLAVLGAGLALAGAWGPVRNRGRNRAARQSG
jgi:hypothetical protein